MCAANHCTVAECEEKMKDGYIAITSGEEMSKAQRHRVPSVLPMPLGSGFIGWLDTQSLIAARLEAESSWAPERTLVGDVLQFNYVDDPTAEHGRVKRYSLGGRFCRSPFWSVSKDLSLEDTIRILHEKKLQRVAVVDVDDSNTPVLGVLTCSDAIRRLSSHRHNIGKLAITTLQSMSSGQLPVPTGRLDQSLESALLAIITQGLQALPITDGTGALVWSLTLNDVQSLAFNTSTAVAACLRMTVCEYLKWHNMFGRCPLSLRMDDSVGIALELMAAMDVLAITIVDAQLTPIGQVTAQHIFEQIVKKK